LSARHDLPGARFRKTPEDQHRSGGTPAAPARPRGNAEEIAMSVQSVSNTNSAWQVLAEMRAARAAAVDPANDETQGSAWSSGTQAGAASGSVAGAAPPAPPPANVLQFFQQLQSVDNAPQATTTDPATTAAGSTGSDTTAQLGNLQSLLASLQPGGSDGTAATGTADPASPDATQTGNDLALQLLSLQGGGWQFGGGDGLATLG
jgi:hypothetical protein